MFKSLKKFNIFKELRLIICFIEISNCIPKKFLFYLIDDWYFKRFKSYRKKIEILVKSGGGKIKNLRNQNWNLPVRMHENQWIFFSSVVIENNFHSRRWYSLIKKKKKSMEDKRKNSYFILTEILKFYRKFYKNYIVLIFCRRSRSLYLCPSQAGRLKILLNMELFNLERIWPYLQTKRINLNF